MEEVAKLDIVDLYKKGYSINSIIDIYYKWKTRHDEPNEKIGNLIVIKRKTITKEDSKREVYKEIYNYIK